MAEYRFLPEAVADLELAIKRYAKQSDCVANRFAEEIESALAAIEKAPMQFAFLHERHQYMQLRKFP